MKTILENGFRKVSVTDISEYSKNAYDKDKSLSQNLVPYMYEEDVERHAEDFLKRHYPKALLQPMPLPVEEIVNDMGMKFFYAYWKTEFLGRHFSVKKR